MSIKPDLRDPCIAVPLSKHETEKIYRGDFKESDCQCFYFSREKLYQIFDTGFFDQLNSKYGICISDYEQEEIVDTEKLLAILNYDIKQFRSLKHLRFWRELEKHVAIAIEKETGVFFLF